MKWLNLTITFSPISLWIRRTLDANYFQTIPYLEEFVKQHNFKFKILVSVHLEPMAVLFEEV